MDVSSEFKNNIDFAVDQYVNRKGVYKNIQSSDDALTQITKQVFGEDKDNKLYSALTSRKDFGFFKRLANKSKVKKLIDLSMAGDKKAKKGLQTIKKEYILHVLSKECKQDKKKGWDEKNFAKFNVMLSILGSDIAKGKSKDIINTRNQKIAEIVSSVTQASEYIKVLSNRQSSGEGSKVESDQLKKKQIRGLDFALRNLAVIYDVLNMKQQKEIAPHMSVISHTVALLTQQIYQEEGRKILQGLIDTKKIELPELGNTAVSTVEGLSTVATPVQIKQNIQTYLTEMSKVMDEVLVDIEDPEERISVYMAFEAKVAEAAKSLIEEFKEKDEMVKAHELPKAVKMELNNVGLKFFGNDIPENSVCSDMITRFLFNNYALEDVKKTEFKSINDFNKLIEKTKDIATLRRLQTQMQMVFSTRYHKASKKDKKIMELSLGTVSQKINQVESQLDQVHGLKTDSPAHTTARKTRNIGAQIILTGMPFIGAGLAIGSQLFSGDWNSALDTLGCLVVTTGLNIASSRIIDKVADKYKWSEDTRLVTKTVANAGISMYGGQLVYSSMKGIFSYVYTKALNIIRPPTSKEAPKTETVGSIVTPTTPERKEEEEEFIGLINDMEGMRSWRDDESRLKKIHARLKAKQPEIEKWKKQYFSEEFLDTLNPKGDLMKKAKELSGWLTNYGKSPHAIFSEQLQRTSITSDPKERMYLALLLHDKNHSVNFSLMDKYFSQEGYYSDVLKKKLDFEEFKEMGKINELMRPGICPQNYKSWLHMKVGQVLGSPNVIKRFGEHRSDDTFTLWEKVSGTWKDRVGYMGNIAFDRRGIWMDRLYNLK